MKATYYSILLFWLLGCAAPSTMLVNQQGQFIRCSATGWGWGGVPAAYMTRNSCVEDFKKIGYIELPDAMMGIQFLKVGDALVITEVRGSAQEVGIRKNDYLLEVDGAKVNGDFDVFKITGAKSPGDSVKVKVNRAGHQLDFVVTLTSR